MAQEPELEEGETCYYKDDATIDPDIALSYIGEKVQSILGHLQKDFEGGVSAENLGAKFGGYGSFLPTYQRSPSIWSQPKSPSRVQTPTFPESPSVCPEGPTPNSVMPSTQRDDSPASPSMLQSHTLKTSSDGASIRQKPTLSSGKVAEAFPGKVEVPSSRSGNPIDHRMLKFRIKVGPETVAQYNAHIHNLGLSSPSSSEGDSHDGSDGLLFDSHETPKESPAYMLKIMASFPVSDGLLLSPLCEDLLNLAKESEYSTKREYEAAPKTSAMPVKLLNNDVSAGMKTKFVDRGGNIEKTKFVNRNGKFEKAEDNFREDLNDRKTWGGDNLECTLQPFHHLNGKPLPELRDSDKDALVEKRQGHKDRVKGRAVSGDLVKDSTLSSGQGYGKHGQPESKFSSVEKIEEHRARVSQGGSIDHIQDSRSGVKGSHLPFNAYFDSSEGEGSKKATNHLIAKVGLSSASSEHNGFDYRAVGRLSSEGGRKPKGSQSSQKKGLKAENLRDGGCAAYKNKLTLKKNIHRPNFSQKDVAHTFLDHTENPNRSLGWPSDDTAKDFNLDDAKAKSAHADKVKERSSNKRYFEKVPFDTNKVEPPAAAEHSKEGIFSGLEQTVAAPTVIQEEWVGCDRCEKWRLLPYGTKSQQLPEKWVCSMLDWLPGMNHCDISEDDTTAAIHASYLVPVPENQHTFQAHANGTMTRGISESAHGFSQNHQTHASYVMKQQKMKDKQNSVSTSHVIPSNGKQKMQHLGLKNGSSKDVKLRATSKSDMQHPNKSATISAKLNKRKGEHVIEDDANSKKKIKESGEYVDGKGEMKRIKSKDALTLDKFQTPGGNLHMSGQSVKSGLPSKTTIKIGKKKSAWEGGFSGGPGNVQMYVKKHGDVKQDLQDDGPLGLETCNGIEGTTKKIRLKDKSYSQRFKDNAYGQHIVEAGQNNENTLQGRKDTVNEDSKDGDFHRNKKPRVSQVEEEFRRTQNDNILSKRISAEARVRSSGSKEYPRDRTVEKEQQVRQARVKPSLTIEDIDKLRKDLGCEQLSTAATSSSSKVSDSRKNRLRYVERKGSPEESVSSSPMRMIYRNQVSPMMTESAGKVDFRFKDAGAVGSANKFQNMNESVELGTARKGTSALTVIDNRSEILDSKCKLTKEAAVDNCHAPKHEVSSNMRHSLSYDSNLKSAKITVTVGKNNVRKSNDRRSEKKSTQREHQKNDLKSIHPCSRDVMQPNLKQDLPRSSIEQARIEPWNGKVRLDLRQGDKQVALCPSKHASGSLRSLEKSPVDSRPDDASVLGDQPKAFKHIAFTCIQDGAENYTSNEAEQYVAPNPSLGNKNVSCVIASTASKEAEDVLKEAEELRAHADLVKNSGFASESNYEYFKAALKFLHGASLLEACNGEPSKQLETRPIQIYGAAAQLCKTCASEYEKGHEVAAAALAYKCVEVAYMRVVYFKSPTTSRVWQDLQSSLQMVPQGESPSSSASDVDNLNNLAITDKAPFSKGSGSLAGNHVIVPRNHPNFVRLLDFTKDVNSAVEAAKRSREAFAAAQLELEKCNIDAIVSIKRVIDFSFQDVEELIRLVLLAVNAINHQGFRAK